MDSSADKAHDRSLQPEETQFLMNPDDLSLIQLQRLLPPRTAASLPEFSVAKISADQPAEKRDMEALLLRDLPRALIDRDLQKACEVVQKYDNPEVLEKLLRSIEERTGIKVEFRDEGKSGLHMTTTTESQSGTKETTTVDIGPDGKASSAKVTTRKGSRNSESTLHSLDLSIAENSMKEALRKGLIHSDDFTMQEEQERKRQ